mmetsp:Transcript_23486/g.57538  ORF Transcript_23486/g.57538 Transcript_23486/m.57538 type:complete len:190 (-) Transcript_23486:63-632(-)|eukprot:CAMPEP_0197591160 /NCGR_PEP_ID=MMETSP1326-20131121/12911_1 /TAXON_ID=1155430 /ORGANISM="Genus nov. species nov., Strain RCC2288" /LENGTH=189 /DNA_ID=CAMNT_0043156531 /DNA_START=123 /DNA_END=692 /DNA_ORIENTATION=+
MRLIQSQRTLEIPEGVTVDIDARNVTVTGERGTLNRSFKHVSVELTKEGDNKIVLSMYFGNRKQLACLRTVESHIKNMITGVTRGYTYKMRMAYAHFPITIEFEEGLLLVKNFIGQRLSRALKMPEGVQVVKSGDVKDQLEITGNDIDAVSQMAALIHGSTRVIGKDIRKFLDGVYVSEKGANGNLVAV